MSNINAIKAVDSIKQRLVEYCLEEHYVKDRRIQDACRSIWSGPGEDGGLTSDLWIEGTFPAKQGGETLKQRVAKGSFSADLCDQINRPEGFGADWTPRVHQSASLDISSEGYAAPTKPAIVVTAGTGAGKTEAFLLPMLNDLYSRQAEIGQGVSCIMLYPLNALVKDQVDRLHGWLKGQNQVRMFSFTGVTPEVECSPRYKFIDGSRFTTRQEARGIIQLDQNGKNQTGPEAGYRVPEILITNYSMLEYMLARPQDQVFFGSNLRTVILDEAHLYRGNLAADIAMLLRRVYLKCGVSSADVVQFATSATIGNKNGEDKLKEFAAKIFCKPVEQVQLIQGAYAEEIAFSGATADHRIDPITLVNTAVPDESTLEGGDAPEFVKTNRRDEWRNYCSIVFGSQCSDDAFGDATLGDHMARVLWCLVPQSETFQKMYHRLFNAGTPVRIKMADLAEEMFPGIDRTLAEEAVRRLLELGAMARNQPSDMPLVPNRIHSLFRAPDGVGLCLDTLGGNADTRIPGVGYLFSQSQVAARQQQQQGLCLTLCRCPESGRWFIAGVENGDGGLSEIPLHQLLRLESGVKDDDGDGDQLGEGNVCFYKIPDNGEEPNRWIDRDNGQITTQPMDGGLGVIIVQTCPDADVILAAKARYFCSFSRVTLSIVGESMLAEMPPIPGQNHFLPARGRRLLAFSDSRNEAARLGPKLQNQHEKQIFRAAIARQMHGAVTANKQLYANQLLTLEGAFSDDPTMAPVIAEIREKHTKLCDGLSIQQFTNRLESEILLSQLQAAGDCPLTPDQWGQIEWSRNHAEVVSSIARLAANEFCRRPSWPQLNTETTGLCEVVYPGLSNVTAPNAIGGLPNSPLWMACWPDFLALICDELRNRGCIQSGFPDMDKENHWGKWYSFDGQDRWQRFCPQQDRSRLGRFLMGIMSALGVANPQFADGVDVLRVAFEQLLTLALDQANFPWLVRSDAGVNPQLPQALRIKFDELRLREPLHLFRCELTGQVWPRQVGGQVPAVTRVDLKEIQDLTTLDQDPRIGRRRREWRESEVFKIGLWAQEHSAQLKIDENQRIQDCFKKGILNVLSSTTTLELGIDIGGLSGVLMGNLPPGKANYIQRAGRAGRRADGSSLVGGFARTSPYERQAFLRFGEYLERPLPDPTVFLHRKKLVLRHLHMFLLGRFMNGHLDGNAVGAMGAYLQMAEFTGRHELPQWDGQQPRPDWNVVVGFPHDSLVSLFGHHLQAIKQLPPDQEVRTLLVNTEFDLDTVWPSLIQEALDAFDSLVSDWCETFDNLAIYWNGATLDGPGTRACYAVLHQARALSNVNVIEALGDGMFIPRYGFPIGVSRLIVKNVAEKNTPDGNTWKVRGEDQYKLERDATMAMREYAPDCEVIASGKKLTSHGLVKHWTGQNAQGAAMLVRGCFVIDGVKFESYPIFAPTLPDGTPSKQVVFPQHGFSTAAWDPPVVSGDAERVGKVRVKTQEFNQMNIPASYEVVGIPCHYREGGEIYVYNEGENSVGYALCLNCGYATSEEMSVAPPPANPDKFTIRFNNHQSLILNPDRFGRIGICPQPLAVLRHQYIASKHITNLLMLDFSAFLNDRDIAVTLGQALRLAGASLLQLDYRELRVLDPIRGFANQQGLAIVIYDSSTGGSGHVEELSMQYGEIWFNEAIKLLTVDGDASEQSKEREAIRRILTSETRDQDADTVFKPFETLDLLQRVFQNHANPPQTVNQSWTLDRLNEPNAQLPTGAFGFQKPCGQVISMNRAQGVRPQNGSSCIVKRNGCFYYGRWCCTLRNGPNGQVQVFNLAGTQINIIGYTEATLPEVFAI